MHTLELHEVYFGDRKIINFSYLLHVLSYIVQKSHTATRLLVFMIFMVTFLGGVLHRRFLKSVLAEKMLCCSKTLICVAAPQLIFKGKEEPRLYLLLTTVDLSLGNGTETTQWREQVLGTVCKWFDRRRGPTVGSVTYFIFTRGSE